MKLSVTDYLIAVELVDRLVDMGVLDYLWQGASHPRMKDWFVSLGGHSFFAENFGFQYFHGASKACFFNEDELSDWVIKVDYRDNSHHYSLIESENYRRAQENGLETYFAATYPLCERDGVSFFIQERVECDENEVFSKWFSLMKEHFYPEDFDTKEEMNWTVADAVEELSDIERVDLLFGNQDLIDFLVDNRINDLHQGNFGFLEDRIVIMDYCGWYQ